MTVDNDTIETTIVPLIIKKDISLRELSKILRILVFIFNAFKDKNYYKGYTIICFALLLIKITKNDIYTKLLNCCNQGELDSTMINELESIFDNQVIFKYKFEDDYDFRLGGVYPIKAACELIEQYYSLSNVKTISNDDEQVAS